MVLKAENSIGSGISIQTNKKQADMTKTHTINNNKTHMKDPETKRYKIKTHRITIHKTKINTTKKTHIMIKVDKTKTYIMFKIHKTKIFKTKFGPKFKIDD